MIKTTKKMHINVFNIKYLPIKKYNNVDFNFIKNFNRLKV